MFFDKIAITLVAVGTNEIMETGTKIGTSSNQVILGGLVVCLILVVLYRERQQNKANKLGDDRHLESLNQSRVAYDKLVTRLDTDRLSWDSERRERISALMTLVTDNTKALEHSAQSVEAIATSVEENTKVTRELSGVIKTLKQR